MDWKTRVMEIPRLKNRVLGSVVGIVLIALAIDLLRFAMFGNDPWSCMILGFSNVSGISYGMCANLYNIVMMIGMLIFGRKYIGIGTFVYLFLIGSVTDLFYWILAPLWGPDVTLTLSMRVVLMAAGIFICSLGDAFYMDANLGIGPYDAISWIIQDAKGGKGFWRFKYLRVCLDLSSAAIGYVLGSIVSIGTMITAFFMGPLINFLIDHVSHPLIYGRE